jgi:hypothetical protein
VPESQCAEGERFGASAADAVGQIGIVIAGDPDPVATLLQRLEHAAVAGCHAQRSAVVMKAVAERDQEARGVTFDQAREPRQRCRGIERRQQHAARRESRSFFQMQIGDDQHLFVRPIERAGGIGRQGDAGERKRVIGAPLRSPGPSFWIPAFAGMSGGTSHCIASFTSSSSDSASNASAASP